MWYGYWIEGVVFKSKLTTPDLLPVELVAIAAEEIILANVAAAIVEVEIAAETMVVAIMAEAGIVAAAIHFW
jgi:hypothetical protein